MGFSLKNVKNVYSFQEFSFCSALLRGKAILVQAWTGRGGSRRLRFPDFKKIDT
jgi:hypothetical protein